VTPRGRSAAVDESHPAGTCGELFLAPARPQGVTVSQPILRTGSARRAPDPAHRRRDLHRLLTSWWTHNARLISVQAHGGADEPDDLTDAVRAIEDALSSRHPLMWEAVQTDLLLGLLTAEHPGDGSSSSSGCLLCHRLDGGLPGSVRQLIELGQAR
jgi:hypothetical protein